MLKETITFDELKEMRSSKKLLLFFLNNFGQDANLKNLVQKLHKLKKEKCEAWLLAQNPELTNGLIAAGANIKAARNKALRLAVNHRRKSVAEILIDNGADLTDVPHWFASRGESEMAKMLQHAVRMTNLM